jgi:hypothetical protein
MAPCISYKNYFISASTLIEEGETAKGQTMIYKTQTI